MKSTATTRNRDADRALSQSDHAILSAVARFHYLTAAQVSRLIFPDCHDESRYARRRLARLVDTGFLLRLKSASLRRGSVPHVFTLARAGRQMLGEDSYYRPQEEQEKARNLPFIEHTLATIDVLIAAELLCRSHPVWMPRLLVERELQARPTRVDLPGPDGKPARTVAVIPDAWFELAVGTRKPLAFRSGASPFEGGTWVRSRGQVYSGRWEMPSLQRLVRLSTAIGALLMSSFLTACAETAPHDFGSIAYSPSKGVVVATLSNSKSRAATAAVEKCRGQGGGTDCWALVWFQNAVGAFARASNPANGPAYGSGVGWADNVAEATKQAGSAAIKGCQQQGGRDCRVIFTQPTPTVSPSGTGGALPQ